MICRIIWPRLCRGTAKQGMGNTAPFRTLP